MYVCGHVCMHEMNPNSSWARVLIELSPSSSQILEDLSFPMSPTELRHDGPSRKWMVLMKCNDLGVVSSYHGLNHDHIVRFEIDTCLLIYGFKTKVLIILAFPEKQKKKKSSFIMVIICLGSLDASKTDITYWSRGSVQLRDLQACLSTSRSRFCGLGSTP